MILSPLDVSFMLRKTSSFVRARPQWVLMKIICTIMTVKNLRAEITLIGTKAIKILALLDISLSCFNNHHLVGEVFYKFSIPGRAKFNLH